MVLHSESNPYKCCSVIHDRCTNEKVWEKEHIVSVLYDIYAVHTQRFADEAIY